MYKRASSRGFSSSNFTSLRKKRSTTGMFLFCKVNGIVMSESGGWNKIRFSVLFLRYSSVFLESRDERW